MPDATTPPPTPRPSTFPAVHGDDLNGRHYRLPRDLEGDLNLVLLVFTQAQQRDANTWLEPAPSWLERFASLRVYELPTLTRLDGLRRPLIDHWMRSGIPDRAARARTVTLYLDRGAFLGALGLPGTDTIHALLVKPAGEVVWSAAGPFTASRGRDLEAVLAGEGA